MIPLNARNSRLLMKWNLRGLSACVARLRRGVWEFSEPVESARTDFQGALDELLERLAARGLSNLPRRTDLFSDHVIAAELKLPIDPARPRPRSEMTEIVRWELDPLIMERIAGHPLGEILVERGRFEAHDVQSVLAEQTERRAGAALARGRHRFGALSLELGLIDREQLEECLTLQQRYREFGESCLCGFQGRRSQVASAPGKFAWMACGVDAARAEEWRAALAERGLRLERIFPLPVEHAALHWNELGPRVLEQQAEALPETVSIDMRPEAPPRLRRPSNLAAAALLLLLISLGLGEAALATLNDGTDSRLARARTELSELKESLRRYDGIVRRTAGVRESLERQRSDLRAVEERTRFLQEAILARRTFIETFLASLGECASEDLVIDRVRETRDGQIVILGFALHDTAVQWFARELLRLNSGAGLLVKDKNVRLAEGRLGLMGYAFDLTLSLSDPAGPQEATR